jgi:N-acylneuraminate cytidylyltransferase
MFAYIPARGGSKRIPRKNIRPLGGTPLLRRVLDNLSKVKGLTGIAVSSEDPEILAVASACPGVVTLAPRDKGLADEVTGFLDLLQKDAPRFAAKFGDQNVLFVTATAALVGPELYERALETHRRAPNGLTLAVTTYQMSPFLALSGNPSDGLKPLFPDMYVKPTKDLPAAYVDAGCFYAVNLDRLAGLRRLLDVQPISGVVLPPSIGIDLDTEEDWKRLEESFRGQL